MKVIDDGDGVPKWTTRVLCKECKAVLEIEEADLRFANTAVGYAGETWCPALYVVCPVCRSDNWLSDYGVVPSGIRSKIYQEHRK